MNVIATIEDLLEVAAGLTRYPKIQLDKEDITIIHSIARQVFKGTALTDRQFALMQEKLSKYKDQFDESCDFDSVVVELRKPLRQIDRSKYIKIVDHPDNIVADSNDKKFIKIRFPFRKTEIMLIQEISTNSGYYHAKGTHEHYFVLNETNAYNVVSNFKNKEFEIDKDLLDYYDKVSEIIQSKKDYVCGIFDNTLLNLNSKIKKIAEDEVGEFNNDTKLFYIDRKYRYGIEHIDELPSSSLTDKIAFRKDIFYHSKPSIEKIDDILISLWNLKRFPLLVILERNRAEEQLHSMISFYRDILPSEEQSVLFRQEGNSEFNLLIKERKLNNWVDKNTKIVYISNDKLPKLLVNSEWSPFTTFSFTSTLDKNVDAYMRYKNDLIIFREEHISPMRRYSRYYG